LANEHLEEVQCQSIFGAGPDDYRDILYLTTVAVLYAGWAAALLWVRRRLADPVDNATQTNGLPSLDWADLAFLQEGARSVFTSAIVWYVQNGYGEVCYVQDGKADYEPKTSRLIPLRPLPEDTHTAVRMIAHAGNTEEILQKAMRSYGKLFQHLESQGLVVPFSLRVKRVAFGVVQLFATMIPIGCSLFSSFLFFHDLNAPFAGNAMSIAFVSGFILLLFSFFLMATLFGQRLSRRGQKVLQAYREQYWPNRRWFDIFGPVPKLDENLTLAVALYGLLVLKHTPLAQLREGLFPPNSE
jgi:uncharacterized protein (TIGR04222 family)